MPAATGGLALNVMRAGDELAPLAPLPAGVTVETLDRPAEVRLGPWLIALALMLLALDVLATLVVSGRLRRVLPAGARRPRRCCSRPGSALGAAPARAGAAGGAADDGDGAACARTRPTWPMSSPAMPRRPKARPG